MAEAKGIVERKFLLDRKNIVLEDMKAYIEEFQPNDKQWFFDLCVGLVDELDKEKKPTGKKVPRSFLSIKKAFYDKYFPNTNTISKRVKLFSDWGLKPTEEK